MENCSRRDFMWLMGAWGVSMADLGRPPLCDSQEIMVRRALMVREQITAFGLGEPRFCICQSGGNPPGTLREAHLRQLTFALALVGTPRAPHAHTIETRQGTRIESLITEMNFADGVRADISSSLALMAHEGIVIRCTRGHVEITDTGAHIVGDGVSEFLPISDMAPRNAFMLNTVRYDRMAEDMLETERCRQSCID